METLEIIIKKRYKFNFDEIYLFLEILVIYSEEDMKIPSQIFRIIYRLLSFSLKRKEKIIGTHIIKMLKHTKHDKYEKLLLKFLIN